MRPVGRSTNIQLDRQATKGRLLLRKQLKSCTNVQLLSYFLNSKRPLAAYQLEAELSELSFELKQNHASAILPTFLRALFDQKSARKKVQICTFFGTLPVPTRQNAAKCGILPSKSEICQILARSGRGGQF